jgi:hypothetical protein
MAHHGYLFYKYGVFMIKENSKFTWGEAVMVKKNAPKVFHPGEFASICSVIKLDPEDLLKDQSLMQSKWLYTIEFEDGSSVEVPEYYLEKYKE